VNKDGERFSLLPLTRIYIQSGESTTEWNEAAYQRLVDYYHQSIESFWGNFQNWNKISQFEKELPDSFAIINYLAKKIDFTEADNGVSVISSGSRRDAELFIDLSDIIARIARVRGYWSDCERISGHAALISRMMGSAKKAGWHYQNIAWINYHRGDFFAAKQSAHEALEQARMTGRFVLAGEANMLLGLISIRETKYTEAERLLLNALQEFPSEGHSYVPPDFWGSLGLLSETCGKWSEAEDWYRQSIAQFRKKEYLPDLAQSLLGLGRVLLHGEHFDDALDAYRESLTAAHICGRADVLAQAHYHMAVLDTLCSRSESAKAHAGQALDQFRRLGMKREQTEAEALLAKLAEAPQDS
jgi:tetratricopeptide (TPR) repeat protein